MRKNKQLKINTDEKAMEFNGYTSMANGNNNNGYVDMGRKNTNSPKPILLMSPKYASQNILPPPVYPPPVQNNMMFAPQARVGLNNSYNGSSIGTYQYNAPQEQQMMMSTAVFPPPVPVAPIYIQPDVVNNSGFITQQPFRPPPQPPDFSGVILFTNGEPVAMYNSGTEQ